MKKFENSLKEIAMILKKNHPEFFIETRAAEANIESPKSNAIFEKIYSTNAWGRSADSIFYSGSGSHTVDIVNPYILAVTSFVSSLPQCNIAVDLGCGDFNVGSKLCGLFSKYTACDVVEPLILYNREKFSNLNVDFKVLDLAADELPHGDIVFVRQVLQHLSNSEIYKFINKITAKYKYAIITEHIPAGDFVSNIDKPSDSNIRLNLNSGVVLTDNPFNLKVANSNVLCECPESGGVIKSIAYEF